MRFPLVLAVDHRANLPEVSNPVVGPVAINVINLLIWQLPALDEPDQVMRWVILMVND